MAEPSNSTPPQQQTLIQRLIGKLASVVILGILLAIGIRWLSNTGTTWQDKPQPAPAASAGSPIPAAPAPAGAEAITSALAHKEARAQAEVRLGRFRERAAVVQREATELDSLITTWETRSKEILSSEQGRQVAANADTAKTAAALLAAPRPGKALTERIRSGCDALLAPVEEAMKRPESIWSPDKSLAELDALAADAEKARDDYSGALRSLDDLIARASRAGKSGELTLAAAIDKVQAERAAAHALELKKLDDEKVKAAQAHELQLKQAEIEADKAAQAKELTASKELAAKARIARDPEALKMLDFTGLGGGTARWSAAQAAVAYGNAAAFKQYAIVIFDQHAAHPSFGAYPTEANQKYQRLDTLAQQQFGASLHELFKIAVDSEANRKAFFTDDELRQQIKDAQARGQTEAAAKAAQLLNGDNRLAQPKYK